MINPSIIESKFIRSKSNLKFTKLWNAIDVNDKKTMLYEIEFNIYEVPIISYFQDEYYWWIISNNSIYLKNAVIEKCAFKEIKKVSIEPLFSGETSKMELDSLQLILEDRIINLMLEPLSWPIIFSILQFVAGK